MSSKVLIIYEYQILFELLNEIKFSSPKNMIVSNVTAEPSNDPEKIRDLLIKQIEKPVRWRESVINMIKQGNKKFKYNLNWCNRCYWKRYS